MVEDQQSCRQIDSSDQNESGAVARSRTREALDYIRIQGVVDVQNCQEIGENSKAAARFVVAVGEL